MDLGVTKGGRRLPRQLSATGQLCEITEHPTQTKAEKAMTSPSDGAFVSDLSVLAADICDGLKKLEAWEGSLPLGALRNRSAHETALAELLKARGLESLSPAHAAEFALTLALAVVKLARRDLLFVRANSRAARP